MDQDTSVCRDIFLACNQSDFQLGMWSVDRKLSMRRGGGGKKVSFTAYSSCRLQLLHIILVWLNHIQTFLKRNIFESSIIYLHFNCLLSVHVFVHEAIHHTELNIYFNNQHVLINAPHNINTGAQSSNT